MRVLIDTNVILDVLTNREEFAGDAVKVFKLCEVRRLEGYISALTLPNLVYIMRKELKREQVKDVVEKLSLLFGIVDLREEDVKRAADMDIPDYEDALQCVQAARIKADFIVTRNLKDFKNSKVMAVKPSELLERLDERSE